MRRLLASLCTGWVLGTAQAAPPPAELFFKPAAIQDVALSPSGSRLALSTRAANGRFGVFVIDLQASSFSASRAILFDDADVDDFYWVDDERLVFSATDLGASAREQNWAPGLYAARYNGTELTRLVEHRWRPWVSNGQRFRSLTWNHRLLHVPVPDESRQGARSDEVVVGEMVFQGEDFRHLTPFWLNTRTGKTRSMSIAGAPDGAQAWWFSAQGEPRAVLTRDRDREALHWYVAPRDGKPGRWQVLAQAPLFQLNLRPVWVGKGDTLYVAHSGGPNGESVVAPFDFATLKPGPALVSAPGFDVEGTLLGDRAGQRLHGVRLNTDAEQTLWFDPDRKAVQSMVDEALPGRVNRIVCRRCDGADAVVLVNSFSDREPGELYLWRKADNGGKGSWQKVGSFRPDIAAATMGITDLHRIRARDGRDLPVWVTRPAGAKAARPAVVLVHGGPWVRGRDWSWQALPQFLASRGYTVIEPEFRGSAGYGQAHLRAGFKQWGQAMQDDVADALLWTQQQGLATQAACIVGGSYGGYSALMGLIRHPELYRCGSAWVAVTDPFLYLTGSWWIDDDIDANARRFGLPHMVGDVDKDREQLLAHSPVARAAEIRRPLQLVWGSDDRRVPLAHGRRLREAMQKAGQEPEWVVFQGEAHGWRKPENQVDFARRLEDFLARHLNSSAPARP